MSTASLKGCPLIVGAILASLIQISMPLALAVGPVPASNDPQTIPFVGVTPSSSAWARLVTGATGGPAQMIFDGAGNGWGMQNGNCLVKVVPNAAGTSVVIEPKYGTSGGGCATTPSVNVLAGSNVFNNAGSGTANYVAWLDTNLLLIVAYNGLYTWDTSLTPSLNSLSQYSTLGGSKLTLDSQGNIYLVQSTTTSNGLGSQNKVIKILQLAPNTAQTVLIAGSTLSNTCTTFGDIVMSPSDILYFNCATGGTGSKTYFVNFATNSLTGFANTFAKGPMAFDAEGNLYVAQTIAINPGTSYWPILTKYSATGVVISYWPYNADREGVSIDAAGNIYAYHPWGYIERVAGSSAPFPPTRVQAVAGNSAATISWLAPSLAGFTTYTATASPGGATCTTSWPTSTCSISGLNGGSNYSVSVTAANATGTSAASGSASVTPYSVAAAPTIGTVAGTSATTVSIPYTAGAINGSAITGYTTTSSPSISLTLTSAATANPLTYSGTFVQGQAYTFSMTATNGAGTSSSSSSSNSITPYAAAAPAVGIIGSVTSSSATTVSIPFTAPSSNGSAITGYTITSSPALTLTFSGTTSPIAVTGAFVQGQSYTFTVAATNGAGTGAASSASNSVTPFAPGNPDAPTIGVATTVDSQTVTVSFSAPTNNRGSAITSYTATSNPGGITGTSSTSPITVTGLTVNTPYTFTVTATNGVGTSDSSTATSAVTPRMTYSVTFDSQGGSSIGNGSFVSGSSISAAPTNPTRSGYTFNGWFAAASGGSVLVFPYAPGVTSNITLYGQWTLIPVVIPPAPTPTPVVVTGPPPSSLKTVTSPKISRDDKGYYCEVGKFVFIREGRTEETPKLSSQVFMLLLNGKVIDTLKSALDKVSFTKSDSFMESTLTCQVEVGQENLSTTSYSLNSESITSHALTKRKAIEVADEKYYKDREDAYSKKDLEFARLATIKATAVTAAKSSKEILAASANYQKAFAAASELWKKELAEASVNRVLAKELAQKQYLDALEAAGISIYPVAVKAIVTPTPTPTPTPKPTPTPTPSPTATNVQPTSEMKKVGTLYMASGTYFLNDASKISLKALALKIKASDKSSVLVYGHTDSRGGVNNTTLSQNRAKAVANYLRPLLKGKKIVIGWYASRKPVTTGTTAADLAKNRRVEIYTK